MFMYLPASYRNNKKIILNIQSVSQVKNIEEAVL